LSGVKVDLEDLICNEYINIPRATLSGTNKKGPTLMNRGGAGSSTIP